MAAIAVVVAVLAALTLLPAMLGILGPHINSLRVRRPRSDEQAQSGLWAKWARDIAKQPIIARAGGARDPDSAGDPAAVADARPAGHRRAVDLDDRAPRLRPDLGELRAGGQRAADRRRLAAVSEGHQHQRLAAGDAAEGRRLDLRRGRGDSGAARQGGNDRVLQRHLQGRAGRAGDHRPGRTRCATARSPRPRRAPT